jgi:hypothetical protein
MRKVEPPIVSVVVGRCAQIDERVWTGSAFSSIGHRKLFIKLLTREQILIECVAAMVGRAHDLPIPQPHIVGVKGAQLPGFTPTYRGWAYGAEDSDTPSLARMTRDKNEIMRRIRSWKRWSEAAAFDTWIGNEQRGASALLWSDDATKVGLMNHEHSFPEWLQPEAESANQILEIICKECDEFSRQRHRKSVMRATEHYPTTDLDGVKGPWSTHFVDAAKLERLLTFLASRLGHLPELIAIAAGTRQQDLLHRVRLNG